MKKLLLLLLLPFFASCGDNKDTIEKSDENPWDFLMKSEAELLNVQNISYNVDYRIKMIDEMDTLTVKGFCLIDKMPSDTIFGYKVRVRRNDFYEKIYDGKNIFSVDFVNKKVIVDNPHKNGPGFIRQNIVKDLIFPEYTVNAPFSRFKKDNPEIKFLPDTNKRYRIVQFKYPDDGPWTNINKRYYINRSTLLPERIIFSVSNGKNIQFNDVYISSIKTNQNITDGHFSRNVIPPDYVFEDFVPPETDFAEQLLQDGSVAPDFELFSMDKTRIKLSKYRGNVVLLDFWFSTCHPCKLFIPHIEKFYRKYQSRGFRIIGMNTDNESRREKMLGDFINEMGMTYPNVFPGDDLLGAYKVQAFPTLYLIGRDGKIKFSLLGYNTGFEDILEKAIENEL